jgi:hypothetical protein
MDAATPKLALVELIVAAVAATEGAEEAARAAAQRAREEAEAKRLAALEAELQTLGLGALQRRAVAEGVASTDLCAAVDSDTPKQAVIAVVLDHARRQSQAASGTADTAWAEEAARAAAAAETEAMLRRELEVQSLSALCRRANECGVDEATLGVALDGAQPKAELVALLLVQHRANGAAAGGPAMLELGLSSSEDNAVKADEAAERSLRAELGRLKLGALSRRAVAAGISAAALEAAQDEDNPALAIEELIVGVESARARSSMSELGLSSSEDNAVKADEAAERSLRAELGRLKLGALSRRAVAAGISAAALEAAQDEDNPALAIEELIVGVEHARLQPPSSSTPSASSGGGGGTSTLRGSRTEAAAPRAMRATNRAHHGGGGGGSRGPVPSRSSAPASVSFSSRGPYSSVIPEAVPPQADRSARRFRAASSRDSVGPPRRRLFAPGKHAMISCKLCIRCYRRCLAACHGSMPSIWPRTYS